MKIRKEQGIRTRNNSSVIAKASTAGITLIALVVTIIVLIILAGISINLVLGENGIIQKAKEAKGAQTEAEAKEKVEMILAEYAMEKEFNNKTLIVFLEENKQIDAVTDNGDGTYTIELDGFAVVINTQKLNIVSVEKNGKTTKINFSKVTAKLNETITATVKFGEEIDYNKCKWMYSTDLQLGTNEASYTNTFNGAENTIELSGTEQETYYLHILVVDKEGNKTEKVSRGVKVGNYVTSITLDKTELTIEEGKEETIVATVEPSDATNKEIEWASSNEEVATVDQIGKITAVKVGKATITATAKDGSGTKTTCSVEVTPKQPVDVSTLEKGIFIEYDVEYTDTYYSSYKYTSKNGWRLIDYKIRDDGKTLYDVKLMSTGIPARMYYHPDDKTNNYEKWVTNSTKLSEFMTILGSDYKTSISRFGLKVSAGFYYNLGEMTFTQGTTYETKNMGYYTKVKNGDIEYTTGAKLGDVLFKAREDANIRLLTLSELNKKLGRNDIDSTSNISDTTGIYQLSKLTNKLEGKTYSSGAYWLASPHPEYDQPICYVGAAGGIGSGRYTYYGIRPLICISSDIQLSKETDTNGFEYYSIIDK